MRTLSCSFFIALCASTVAAEDSARLPVLPQPRVRLDPVSRAAVVTPRSAAITAVKGAAIMMEEVVVNEERRLPSGPAHPDEHKGAFSPAAGGHVLKGSQAGLRWEIGAWSWVPWTDVMWEDLKKFPKPKTRIDVDVVRIHW